MANKHTKQIRKQKETNRKWKEYLTNWKSPENLIKSKDKVKGTQNKNNTKEERGKGVYSQKTGYINSRQNIY
jgi:hypothetical protein